MIVYAAERSNRTESTAAPRSPNWLLSVLVGDETIGAMARTARQKNVKSKSGVEPPHSAMKEKKEHGGFGEWASLTCGLKPRPPKEKRTRKKEG